MTTVNGHSTLLPHLFRLEYSKMTAVLCRHFGLKHIEIAEDIASETFLKAFEYWAVNGIPENPTAWLYTVAKNKAKDFLKRVHRFETQVRKELIPQDIGAETAFEFSAPVIADSQLAMIFAVCNTANSSESQICLALQILCGFSVAEIANAFLTKSETIKKRLHRARTNLRNDQFQITALCETEIRLRLDTVLKTLYLLFNEGYFSKTNNQIIRKDLCAEALRLALILTEHAFTNTSQTNALLALMCFQSSRLNARADTRGEAVLFEEQDKNLWDQQLIQKGNRYLVNACDGTGTSKYHLEAAIAYWHTAPGNVNKWPHILQLYNQLLLMEYTPVAELNRIFALAKVHGNALAIPEAEKLNLEGHHDHHSLLGYLYTGIDKDKAYHHYMQAAAAARSKPEKQLLIKQANRLIGKENR